MSPETQELSSGKKDARSLASSLAPIIIHACENRLSDIRWFKADWQRGGAATALASYRDDTEREVPVVLKLPVGPRELTWTRRLQQPGEDGVIGKLFASGDSLGGYDLAWIVIEKFEYGPLGKKWHRQNVLRLCEAASRFYLATSKFLVDRCPLGEDWHQHLRDSIESVKVNRIQHQQQWNKAIKTLRSVLDPMIEEWDARDKNQWLHGDLHLANAMSRTNDDAAPICLIDLAEVHAGDWIEDGIYLERQLWAMPDRLKPHPPLKTLAKARKELGLPVEENYPRLATIRRALLASTAPKFIKSEGHPVYLEACLQRLENALNELK